MLDENQLSEIVDFVADLSIKLDKGKEVHPHKSYAVTVELYEDVRVHSQLSTFPHKLISKSAPNETQAEFDYKESTYQPITRPVWREATTQVNRIFNKQNYSITGWGNDEGIYEDESAEDYFLHSYPEFHSILNYFENVLKPAKDEDPNAVAALDFTDLNFSDTELPEPVLFIYHAPHVMKVNKEMALLLTSERSPVKYANSVQNIGFVFKLYDKENIYKIKQVGKKTEWTFEIEIYYAHNLGYVPVEYLKGQAKKDEDCLYFESLFMDAIPNLNDALIDATNLRVNKVANLFMERIEWVDECDEDGCDGGYIVDYTDGEAVKRSCPSCNGVGKKSFSSPLGVTQVQIPNRMNDSGQLNFDPVTYVKKDHTLIEALRKEINSSIEGAFKFMGIEISMDKKSGTETATGKLIDRENLYAFISLYSNQTFALLNWAIKTLGKSRYGTDFVEPNISEPVSYALRSEMDLAEEYKEIDTMPDLQKAQTLREYNDVRFSDDEVLKMATDLQQQVDVLYLKNTTEVIATVSTGIFDKWRAVLHFSFDSYISQKDASFWEQDFQSQQAELIAMAKTDVAAETQGSTASIIENANS